MDFYSMLLARKLKKESGGDVTIESLVVTENGNYSETGKAYSPVVVNVPFPENGYFLKSASGQAINLTDGAPLYLQECKAKIESVQEGSGDPSPTNIRPISGQTEVNVTRCGKNLCPINNINGTIYQNMRCYLPQGTYTISVEATSTDTDTNICIAVLLDKNGDTIQQLNFSRRRRAYNVFTTTKDVYSINFYASDSYAHSINDTFAFNDIQIEPGSTATEYEAYNGKTYTIQLGETIYGGELDIVTGEVTVTHESVDLGDLSWTLSDGFFGTNELIATVKKPINNQTMVNAISSIYPIMTWADITAADTAIAVSVEGQMIVGNPNITSVADFVTAVSGQTLVYELAEPQTIQLTPKQIRLLEGVNNLSCNTGELNIEYFGKGVN